MPRAPSGGRLREADTRPLPRGESGVRRDNDKIAWRRCDLGPAEGASPVWAETRRVMPKSEPQRSGQAGLGRAANVGRAIAPDRGPFRPRAAPRAAHCYRATRCHLEAPIIAHLVLDSSLTPNLTQ